MEILPEPPQWIVPHYEPTLHKAVPMNTRVKVDASYLGYEATGTVVGVCFVHVIFSYIVLLDIPVTNQYGEQRAISVIGSHLTSEDGKTHWRLND